MSTNKDDNETIPFLVTDYIQNPVRAARIKANISQRDLANKLKVTQVYISKIEARTYKVSEKLINKIKSVIPL